MKNNVFSFLTFLSLLCFVSCTHQEKPCCKPPVCKPKPVKSCCQKQATVQQKPHRYGGWYCPDNLGGFAPIDIRNWNSVPVINDRLPTKEETRSGKSLIFVDVVEYPNARPLEMKMPQLAQYYNNITNREEVVIVIQAIEVQNDSIVGFRYLNGGNGSARLNQMEFLSENEINQIPSTRFVHTSVEIKNTQDQIWKVLTTAPKAASLKAIYDSKNSFKDAETSNVNYQYVNAGAERATYADKLYGNYYIQNDYVNFTEKFLLQENEKTKITTLQIVCGPFGDDYKEQEKIIKSWAKEVKYLSEEGC